MSPPKYVHLYISLNNIFTYIFPCTPISSTLYILALTTSPICSITNIFTPVTEPRHLHRYVPTPISSPICPHANIFSPITPPQRLPSNSPVWCTDYFPLEPPFSVKSAEVAWLLLLLLVLVPGSKYHNIDRQYIQLHNSSSNNRHVLTI